MICFQEVMTVYGAKAVTHLRLHVYSDALILVLFFHENNFSSLSSSRVWSAIQDITIHSLLCWYFDGIMEVCRKNNRRVDVRPSRWLGGEARFVLLTRTVCTNVKCFLKLSQHRKHLQHVNKLNMVQTHIFPNPKGLSFHVQGPIIEHLRRRH